MIMVIVAFSSAVQMNKSIPILKRSGFEPRPTHCVVILMRHLAARLFTQKYEGVLVNCLENSINWREKEVKFLTIDWHLA